MRVRWIVDGNNVLGSRPDGWWNDRPAAQRRFTQRVAEWCRTHDDDVTIVFDAPVDEATRSLAGGNLSVVEATRRGRDAADDTIVELVDRIVGEADEADEAEVGDDREPIGRTAVTVVTSDRGLRRRLPDGVEVVGVGAFRDRVRY